MIITAVYELMVDPNQVRGPAQPAESAITPEKLLWLHDTNVSEALRRFGVESGIDFPLPTEMESPAQRNKSPIHVVKHIFSTLFFIDRDVLEQRIKAFLSWRPIFDNQNDKIKNLLELLSNENKDYRSLLASGRASTPRGSIKQASEGRTPQSPTLSAKHAPKITVDEIGEIDEVQLPALTAVTSNNTSFATTSAHTSFWSEVQQRSQGAQSPATTFSESFPSSENSGSSKTETFQEKLAKAGVSTETLVDPGLQLDGVHDSSTQETNYGSSWSQALDNGPELPFQIEETSPSKAAAVKGPEWSPEREKPEHHRVKNIASDGLSDIILPEIISKLPFALRCETFRFLQASKLAPAQFLEQWDSSNQELGLSKSFASLHQLADKLCLSFRRGIETAYENHSLCAKMRWTQSSSHGRLLKLELLPAQKLPLNAFQRKFESHRFLFVEVDPLSKPPEILGLSGQGKQIQTRFLEMLAKEHEFLGRTWIQFHTQEKKRSKVGGLESDRAGLTQHIFVALRGDNLSVLNLRDVWCWAVPLKENARKPWGKVWSRSDLFTSRTKRALVFSPSEVRRVGDTLANRDLPDTQFNDPDPGFDFHEEYEEDTVMDDGCSEAHEWVLRSIGEACGTDGIPSAAQFRIGPAKGVIVKKRPDNDHDCDLQTRPRGVLMKITDSQLKLTTRENEHDEHLLALNVVSVSQALKPSYLYFDFLCIMIDRHVPARAIEDCAELQAKRDVAEFLEALKSGNNLRDWISRQRSSREELGRDTDIGSLAGFPRAMEERAIQMLEAGFEPTKFAPLAELVRVVACQYFNQQKKAYKISLPQSTMALAVPDCHRILKPGEIQLNFSSRFNDPHSGKSWSHLNGPVLVSRNPAARPSDMQKVKAVYYPELDHLYDVVIFPCRGRQPLAGKLSGGDYDGDKMWICWEPSLVKDFKNAPAPRSLPDPGTFGMVVDERPLCEIVTDPQSEEQVRNFVRMGTANRLRMNLLGTVTKTLERQIYRDNSLSTAKARTLADLKDLIMDREKNGRSFTEEAWNKVKSENGFGGLPDPAYFKTTSSDNETSRQPVTPGREMKPKPENILDKLHCIILKKVIDDAIEKMRQVLSVAVDHDEDLSALYEKTFSNPGGNRAIDNERANLKGELSKLKERWDREMVLFGTEKTPIKRPQRWNEAVISCRKVYESIRPDDPEDASVVEWLRPSGNWPTTWGLLKASALVKFYGKSKICFNIAGSELCLLKAQASREPTRTMLLSRYMGLKPRKRKRLAEVSEDPSDGNGDIDGLFDVDGDLDVDI